MEHLKDFKTSSITVNAKICLVLMASVRANVVFQDEKDIYDFLSEVHKKEWEWAKERKIRASELYKWVPKFYEIEQQIKHNERQKCALFSNLYCLYYVISWADAFDWKKYQKDMNNLPEDVAEVNDTYVVKCLEHSLKALRYNDNEKEWQKKVIQKMLLKYPAYSEEDFGEIVTDKNFKDV